MKNSDQGGKDSTLEFDGGKRMAKTARWFLVTGLTVGAALVASTALLQSGKTVDKDLATMSWSDVLAEAKGQTVSWFMWGGADNINKFVDDSYGAALKKLGVTLKRVPLTDTADAVNKVLGEKQAGKNAGGSIDLIWINGENFKTAKQGKLLFEGWAEKIPNAKYVNWKNPAVANDFGFPVQGSESPWGSAQWQYVYDSARVKEADAPKSFKALLAWAKAHPGRFTFVAPPAFYGNRFLRMILFELSGGRDAFDGAFNEKVWNEKSPALWAYLKEIKPFLWRKGETFPKDIADLNQLYANGEVDFTFTQTPGGIAAEVASGKLPTSSRLYLFDAGTVADFHYVAIPYNSGSKAAALVLANTILDPDLQVMKATPKVWGDGLGIDANKLDANDKAKLAKELVAGPHTLAPGVLAAAAIGDVVADYDKRVQDGFKTNVLGQ